ncbi:senescence/dehydration-associated protein At4g35985, chloroplastic-like [Aristolochia californica]|uniref:senescence/dehydration-associated protein At4g35985, chloroplastic-like n=1 Tax=Aristolochia californica TaxID=171875 RepID=UPI0035D732E6
MNCFRPKTRRSSPKTTSPVKTETNQTKTREEILLRIPNSSIHLMEGGETVQLAQGDFVVVRLVEDDVVLATFIKVGKDLQWPLTKDEPVVKVDRLDYLFSLPSEGDEILSYGVSFSETGSGLDSLDAFLQENSCFSSPTSDSPPPPVAPLDARKLYWKKFAPRVEDYNGVIAKAIAGGTGEVVKGIFKCSNAYVKLIQKEGEMIRSRAPNNGIVDEIPYGAQSNTEKKKKKSEIQKGMKRVRKLSKMTEKMSKTLLNGVMLASGSVTAPLIRSQTGKRFLAMVPGQVLLASLDAVNRVLDALEAAEKETFSATSTAVSGAVSRRYGESAGEITEDAFASAGHAAGTAWNIFKIRKAINPASSLPSSILKNAAKTKA